MVQIGIYPHQLWEFFKDNSRKMEGAYMEIAFNDISETKVFITSRRGLPYLLVVRSGVDVFDAAFATEYETECGLEEIYIDWIYGDDSYEKEVIQEIEEEELMLDREEELLEALDDFIYVATDSPWKDNYTSYDRYSIEENTSEILDAVCQVLANFGKEVYRPMRLNVDEESVFSYFPYNEFRIVEDY